VAIVAVIVLFNLFRQRPKRFLIMAGAVIAVGVLFVRYQDALASVPYLAPIVDRAGSLLVIFTEGSSVGANASSLILATAIFVTGATLVAHPFGMGVDRYIYANAEFGTQFASVQMLQVNARDGASILAKYLTEFGDLGAVLFVLFVFYLRRRFIRTPNKDLGIICAVSACIILANSVRGAGYFSGGIVLATGLLAGSFIKLGQMAKEDQLDGDAIEELSDDTAQESAP